MNEQSYYNKKKVYGDNPLMEIIYEIEEAYEYDSFRDRTYISREKMDTIAQRHKETVKEFKNKLSRLVN